MKLILIHGRAQQNLDEQKLKQKWIDALADGLKKSGLMLPEKLEIGFPYYGDLLDELTKAVVVDGDVVTRGAEVTDQNEKTFFYELLSEVAEKNEISDADIDKNYVGDAKERGPLNWEWIQAILKTLDEHTSIGDMSLRQFTRDVFLYLTVGGIRRTIDDFVRNEINSSPCVVVGHSLGSIVGYNVLKSLPQISANKYITVGSPLGLKSVRSKLEIPIMMPSSVKKGWYNAYDERDVVALQPLNERHFNVDPAIVNYGKVRNFTDNRHGIEGYLSDKEVALKIYEQLI